MAWLRSGDTAATDPRLLRTFEHSEYSPGLRVTVWGFVHLCATISAEHCTDYVVEFGMAMAATMEGPEYTRWVLGVAELCGLMERVVDGDRITWRIVDDEDLLHMRSAAEIEKDTQRKRDGANHALVIPVRVRDGDQCRYCRKTVAFGDRRSSRGGTYDHREGVGKETTVDTLVVACRDCNRARSDNPDADLLIPLLPAPCEPFYTPSTAERINSNSWAQTQGITVSASPSEPSGATGRKRPANPAGNAPLSTTSQGIAHASDSDLPPGIAHASDSDQGKTGDAVPHPAGNGGRHRQPPRPRAAAPPPDLVDPGESCLNDRASKSGFAGTGRDGSGPGGVGKPKSPGKGDDPLEISPDSGLGRRSRGRRRTRKRS